ncbi:glycosyltransferase family 2 protein [Chloroflexales bacterium ZM16-3]|nr:glycosyltransferase family 2 protein [Chloroflexales bacterium ZM16-3]
MQISVVIPTYQRPQTVGQTVRSIFAGDYENFEVIVVDQSKDDASRVALAGFMADPRFRYIKTPRLGASAARNLGIAAGKGEVIAFTDDDVTAEAGWLAKIAAEFNADAELQFISGALVAPEYDRSAGYIPEFTPFKGMTGWQLVLMAANANFAMRRALFDRIGGYDELCGPGGVLKSSDDGDIVLRIVRSGARWKGCPHIQVTHTYGFRAGALADTLLDEYDYGNGAIFGRAARRGDLLAAGWFMARETKLLLRGMMRALRGAGAPSLPRTRLAGFWHGFQFSPHENIPGAAELRSLGLTA